MGLLCQMLSVTTHVQTGGGKESLGGPARVGGGLLVLGEPWGWRGPSWEGPRSLCLSTDGIFFSTLDPGAQRKENDK